MAQREEYENLPKPLQESLRDLYAGPAMPTGRDAAILSAARQAAGRVPRRWAPFVATGIAAAIALAVGITWHHYTSTTHAFAKTGDIRDAFYVARQLKTHAAINVQWDVNHDGVIDDRDVEMLALAAVKVSGSPKPAGGTP